MKSIRLLILTAAFAALALPATSFAAGKGKEGKGGAKAVRQYDSNSNGSIDGAEIEALKKAFDADKTGPLKEFDTDSDGKLSDSEVAAIKVKQKKAK